MLDIKFIKENENLVKDSIKKRFLKDKLNLVDEAIESHNEWVKLKQEADSLRSKRNKVSEEIN